MKSLACPALGSGSSEEMSGQVTDNTESACCTPVPARTSKSRRRREPHSHIHGPPMMAPSRSGSECTAFCHSRCAHRRPGYRRGWCPGHEISTTPLLQLTPGDLAGSRPNRPENASMLNADATSAGRTPVAKLRARHVQRMTMVPIQRHDQRGNADHPAQMLRLALRQLSADSEPPGQVSAGRC